MIAYMTDKELRRLRRDELLEILLGQQKEIDRLTAALAEAEKKLEDREIKIMNAGSIAEASLALTEVFAQAQRAADLYIDNIRRRTGAVVEPEAETADAAALAAAAETAETEASEETPAGENQATAEAEAAAVTEEAVAETAVETALETADAEVREAETAVENEQTEGEKAQDKTADAPEGGETAV